MIYEATSISCISGTVREIPCDVGSYQKIEGQDKCIPCEEGKMCPNITTIEPEPCHQGYYCPGGPAKKCPPGTFNNRTGSVSDTACMCCPAGQFCPGEGSINPKGPCAKGFYCKGGASSMVPNTNLTTTITIETTQCNITAGNDTSGNDTAGIDTTTVNGTITTTMVNTTIECNGDTYYFGPCPAGHFCPSGVSNPRPCPRGTFKSSTGGESESDCQPCTGGHYCGKQGLTKPSGPCHGGYYCPANESIMVPTPDKYTCTPGHFCPNGSESETDCPAGKSDVNFVHYLNKQKFIRQNFFG